MISGKILVKKGDTFLSPGSCWEEGIRNDGDYIHFNKPKAQSLKPKTFLVIFEDHDDDIINIIN